MCLKQNRHPNSQLFGSRVGCPVCTCSTGCRRMQRAHNDLEKTRPAMKSMSAVEFLALRSRLHAVGLALLTLASTHKHSTTPGTSSGRVSEYVRILMQAELLPGACCRPGRPLHACGSSASRRDNDEAHNTTHTQNNLHHQPSTNTSRTLGNHSYAGKIPDPPLG